jgi:hypothetical protein
VRRSTSRDRSSNVRAPRRGRGQAGQRLGAGRRRRSAVTSGPRPAGPREVERLLDYYGVSGTHRAMLLALAQDASQKGWWEEYAESLPEDYQQFIGLEHEATGATSPCRSCRLTASTPYGLASAVKRMHVLLSGVQSAPSLASRRTRIDQGVHHSQG